MKVNEYRCEKCHTLFPGEYERWGKCIECNEAEGYCYSCDDGDTITALENKVKTLDKREIKMLNLLVHTAQNIDRHFTGKGDGLTVGDWNDLRNEVASIIYRTGRSLDYQSSEEMLTWKYRIRKKGISIEGGE